ncbi:MAG: hypothetical protein QM594_21480 [Niabella sp.]
MQHKLLFIYNCCRKYILLRPKRNLSFLFIISSLFAFSQNEVNYIREVSRTFKGTIDGAPITIFLQDKEIIDCNLHDRFIEGWYYYNKYKIKIPLNGYSHHCDMRLYYFGANHKKDAEKAAGNASPSTIDSVYSNADYAETLIFDRCHYTSKKATHWKGEFKTKTKTAEILINADNISIGREYEYFKLPDSKIIDLRKIFPGYGGNKFFSLTENRKENRVIFYFESISNHNACGRCGASEGEKGYRVIYFDKNWGIKKTSEYLTESCLENIYDTEIIKKTKNLTTYAIKDIEGNLRYHLVVDKLNAEIKKAK